MVQALPVQAVDGSGTRGHKTRDSYLPTRSAQEPQLYLSEDATMSSRLPFISRATTLPRPRGGLRTFLDTPNTMEQVGKLPCPRNQKLVGSPGQLATRSHSPE